MFGLGFGEVVIIAILALLLLGPERLPDAAKTLGKTLRELRKHTDDLKDQFETELYADERKKLRPTLVPPVPVTPVAPDGPPPPATAENVPGLEAALVGDEPPTPQAAAVPPAPSPAAPAASPTEKA